MWTRLPRVSSTTEARSSGTLTRSRAWAGSRLWLTLRGPRSTFFQAAAPHERAAICGWKWERACGWAADGIAGSICWRELTTTDLEAADAFDSSLFGWSKGEAIDMGETGTSQILTGNGLPFGGMMIKSQEAPVPCWSFYFSVDGVGAAVERVREHGGRTLYGPSQVAGGGWIAMCFDPRARSSAPLRRRADSPHSIRKRQAPSIQAAPSGSASYARAPSRRPPGQPA